MKDSSHVGGSEAARVCFCLNLPAMAVRIDLCSRVPERPRLATNLSKTCPQTVVSVGGIKRPCSSLERPRQERVDWAGFVSAEGVARYEAGCRVERPGGSEGSAGAGFEADPGWHPARLRLRECGREGRFRRRVVSRSPRCCIDLISTCPGSSCRIAPIPRSSSSSRTPKRVMCSSMIA